MSRRPRDKHDLTDAKEWRAFRRRHLITRRELAEALGISYWTIAQIENNKQGAGYKTRQLLYAYRVKMGDIKPL